MAGKAVSTRERTTVWVLENTLDGQYTPEAYFGTPLEANFILDELLRLGESRHSDKWRVTEKEVWMEARFYLEESESHTAKWLRVHTDPEYAEYQRLDAKFKAVWK